MKIEPFKVMCIDVPEGLNILKINQVYTVTHEEDEFYYIITDPDKELTAAYFKRRFIIIELCKKYNTLCDNIISHPF